MKTKVAQLIAMALASFEGFGANLSVNIREPKSEKDPTNPIQAEKIRKAEAKRKMRMAKRIKQ